MEAGDPGFISPSYTQEKLGDEELENFLGRVDEVSEIIRGLASVNANDQEKALRKADLLIRDDSVEIDEKTVQCQVKANRTVINKIKDDPGEGDMSQDGFMRMMEKDANNRAKDRKERKEKSDALRKSGNLAFKKQNYAEALCAYNQAIGLIKDSPCLYNNRALTYIRIGIFSKAIQDCDNAIELAEFSMKARLLKAKAYFLQGEANKAKECLQEAREKYPSYEKMVKTFEDDLFDLGETRQKKALDDDVLLGPEEFWRKASKHELPGPTNTTKEDLSED